jgi:low affinity Fe/Cu permease
MSTTQNETEPLNASTRFVRFTDSVSRLTGSSLATVVAAGAMLVWLLSGPLFHFSDTWQLVVNTGTTVLTFLMVFIIQAT